MFYIKYYIMVALFYLFRIFPIQKNKILISSFAGKGYGDNGKAIAEELLKDSGYDIVWLCNDEKAVFPKGIRKVPFVSLRSVYEQCTAKVWIDNRRKPGYVRKRKGQCYIYTCHGNNGIKRVEMDAADALEASYIKAAMNDSAMADIYVSGSAFDTKIYRQAYRFFGEVMEVGFPRQDVLFQEHDKKKQEIKRAFGIAEDEKVLLYVPTFRKDLKNMDLSVYQLSWLEVLEAMGKRFGGTWRGISRLHPNVAVLGDSLCIPDSVINATSYPDMEELMMIADCVISDYSSTIIEGGASGKLGFFFALDIAAYMADRNFYIQLEDFPFPLAQSNEELIQNIQNFDNEKYEQDIHEFFTKDYGFVGNGNSSRLVADRIKEIVKTN